jgi:replication factor A1
MGHIMQLCLQVFNDQAEALLGCTADELAAAKEGDPARFAAVLRAATWTQWVLRVKAQAQ